jgi:hypothetical protein
MMTQFMAYEVDYFDMVCIVRARLMDELEEEDIGILAEKMREAVLSASGDMRKDYIEFEAFGYGLGRGELKESVHSRAKEELKILHTMCGPNSPLVQNWQKIDDAVMRGWKLAGADPIDDSRVLFDDDFNLSCRGLEVLEKFLQTEMIERDIGETKL